MAQFGLSSTDILYISAALNYCFLLQMVATRAVKCLLPVVSKRGSSKWRTLFAVHQRWPDLLGRLLMEQVSLATILLLIVSHMGSAATSMPPFQEHDSATYRPATRLILSANTARYIAIFISILYNSDVKLYVNKTVRQRVCGSTLQCIYCLLGIASNVIGLGFKQNIVLLILSPFMEINSTVLVVCHLMKLTEHMCCKSYLKTAILCCGVCILSRFLFPVLFLYHAFSRQTPFVMDDAPKVWFFISGGFYLIFHSMFLYFSIMRILKASKIYSQGCVDSSSCCQATASKTIDRSSPQTETETEIEAEEQPSRLVNDIFNEFSEDGDEEDVCSNNTAFQLMAKKSKIREVNYGFMPCYDNKNLYYLIDEIQEEKLNFLNKKNSSKHELIVGKSKRNKLLKFSDKSLEIDEEDDEDYYNNELNCDNKSAIHDPCYCEIPSPENVTGANGNYIHVKVKDINCNCETCENCILNQNSTLYDKRVHISKNPENLVRDDLNIMTELVCNCKDCEKCNISQRSVTFYDKRVDIPLKGCNLNSNSSNNGKSSFGGVEENYVDTRNCENCENCNNLNKSSLTVNS